MKFRCGGRSFEIRGNWLEAGKVYDISLSGEYYDVQQIKNLVRMGALKPLNDTKDSLVIKLENTQKNNKYNFINNNLGFGIEVKEVV